MTVNDPVGARLSEPYNFLGVQYSGSHPISLSVSQIICSELSFSARSAPFL